MKTDEPKLPVASGDSLVLRYLYCAFCIFFDLVYSVPLN